MKIVNTLEFIVINDCCKINILKYNFIETDIVFNLKKVCTIMYPTYSYTM